MILKDFKKIIFREHLHKKCSFFQKTITTIIKESATI